MIAMCISLVFVSGCGADSGHKAPGSFDGGGWSPAPGEPSSTDGDETPSEEEKDTPPEFESTVPKAGQLTAAEWKDVRDYKYWLSMFSHHDEQQQPVSGDFDSYLNAWGIDTRYPVSVKVVCGDGAVAGASVKLYDGEALLFSAVTDATGMAWLFAEQGTTACRITAESGEYKAERTVSYEYGMDTVEIELEGGVPKAEIIEIMFVVDTTGSMGDEIAYLKAELADVISSAAESVGAEIKMALLLYRDIGDRYVTKYYDFTTDLSAYQKSLNAVVASGGGDYPEAVDIALSEAVAKQWSSGNTTKLIFHVLDAPPHDGQENKTLFTSSIMTAAEKGIRMIPVASSGIDGLTEYLLRSEALVTGGTYTFLTDDSGIGESHLEPTVGAYTVEYLNALLIRLIDEYYTGVPTQPVSWRAEQ